MLSRQVSGLHAKLKEYPLASDFTERGYRFSTSSSHSHATVCKYPASTETGGELSGTQLIQPHFHNRTMRTIKSAASLLPLFSTSEN